MKRKAAVAACLVLGAAFLAQACGGDDCESFKSPCQTPFDVATWCGDSHCQIDGKPTCSFDKCSVDWCAGDSNGGSCDFAAGSVLSITISQFAADLKGKDLQLLLANGGCDGGPGDLHARASLDGIDGAHYKIGESDVFIWIPFPSDPQILEVSYSNASALGCTEASITFVDEVCEVLHPAPDCPV